MPAPLVLHVGYPKTGTTTLQQHVFPNLSGVCYLGKYIPSYSFEDPALGNLLASAYQDLVSQWDPLPLKKAFSYLREDKKNSLLISTEALVHPIAVDPSIVGARLCEVAPDAKIIFTLRAQTDLLKSFYRNHGAFGSFLYLNKTEKEPFNIPLSPDEWLDMNFSAPWKNILGILDYDSIISDWVSYFGKESIFVLLFEDMEQGRSDFTNAMAAALGVKSEALDALLEGRHENPGMTADQYQDFIQLIKAGGEKSDSRTPPKVESEILPIPVNFGEDSIRRIEARFSAGNSRLSGVLGRDLAALGYPV